MHSRREAAETLGRVDIAPAECLRWPAAPTSGDVEVARRGSAHGPARQATSRVHRGAGWHASCWEGWAVWFDDVQFTGTLIIALIAIPYVVEILGQLPLLARVMRALPEQTRAALPRHPRRPWLAMFGSARFFLALLRFALHRAPADAPEIATLKHKMRASLLRQALFGIAFCATVVALWRQGWRPPWP
jgi:hypothetical protein